MLGVFEYRTGRGYQRETPIETDLVFCLLKKEYKFEKYIDRCIVF